MKFAKSPLSLQEQILHIEKHYKIKCKNKSLIEKYLFHCNYYKVRGYWLFFEEIEKEVYFEEVINLYEFDKKLRMLFMNYIEIVETSIKSIFAYHLTNKYGSSHIHLRKCIFHNEKYYYQSIEQLKNNYANSKEIYANHFKTKYDEDLPPLWASVEIMTLGEISKWFSNLNKYDQKEISNYYNFPAPSLRTLLINLTEVRNICAHHSRLWNKRLTKAISIPRRLNISTPHSFKIYHTLITMNELLKSITSKNYLLCDFCKITLEHNIPIKYMGFPKHHNLEGLENAKYEY